MSFIVGQRWISESENNLGLGIIRARDNRTVTVDFPAADEQRLYNVDIAPLTRVAFQAGDVIKADEGWELRVESVAEKQGILFYLGTRVDDGNEAVLPEMQLAHQVSFSKPQDRLFSAQIDRSDRFSLRYQALQHQQAQFQSPLRGLRGVRASLIPHQLHIAREVGSRVAPRVLLADEVGLGKTLEAGMILQQQIFAGRANRVLVLVPENLQHQWIVEMLRRFNLNFSLFDEERCEELLATDSPDETQPNPFETESLIICAMEWLERAPHHAEHLLRAQWDMLIVDEAHHLAWSETESSRAYQLVEALSAQIPSVLLLTATPEQLGQASHFARLRLLDPKRFYDYAQFVEEQNQFQPVADAVSQLLSAQTPSPDAQRQISALLSEASANRLVTLFSGELDASARQAEIDAIIRELIDRHGTSRVLFRNTRQAIKGFPARHFHAYGFALPSQYQNALTVLAMTGGLNDGALHPEQMMLRLNSKAKWGEFDPRIDWLIQFLKNAREEKVLVICQQANTAIQLEQILREREGIHSAVFHEGMSIVERDRAAAYFAQQEAGAQVLISSSIGSEGRNFQFACHLVLFGLPENPDILEQSIGRLDRIGQQRDIHIHVPFFENSAQHVLLDWYHQGLNAFEETCPMGNALFAEFGATLKSHYNSKAQGDFSAFLTDVRTRQQAMKAALEQGRDRLLELNSQGGEAAYALAQEIGEQDADPALVDFAFNLFDVVGLEQEDLGEKSVAITPTSNMLVPDFPGLDEEGNSVTFDRALALAREELLFLSWDHPIIRNGIDLITTGDIGKTAVSMLINNQVPTGTLLLECIYVVEAQAPKELALTRFLPPTPVRLLLDAKGRDLSASVSSQTLQKQLKPINKQMAVKVAKMARKNIEMLLKVSEKLIKPQAESLIETAQQTASQQLSAEINRLVALQSVNKSIRQDEIDTLVQNQTRIFDELSRAGYRLDSLRVIITNQQ